MYCDEPRGMLDKFGAGLDDAPYLNDLEPPAFNLIPELQQLREELTTSYKFRNVMMSGSGSTIFCVGEPSDDAKATWQEELRAKHSGVEIYEQAFCGRPDDEQVWY